MSGAISSLPAIAVTTALYALALPNLVQMKRVGAAWSTSRGGRKIDEVVLHGTESGGTEQQSADYLSGANKDGSSIHYFIGRTTGVLYAMAPEERGANHSGLHPKKVYSRGIVSHNDRSIGIEMYQRDVAAFKGDRSKLDFTDWQYETVAMLVYDICHRRGIARKNVVAHGKINWDDRADPQGFDWTRFNRRLDALSAILTRELGVSFTLS
jgi:N-acetyl-anhydromuramyl-L-alanine amidase AmpD